MSSNLDRFTADLDKLTSLSDEMLVDLSFQQERTTGSIQKEYEELAKKTAGSFEKNYQIWYTQACAVVRQLLPGRLTEFVQLYHGDGKRKTIDVTTYHIQDWLNGVRSQASAGAQIFNDFGVMVMRFQTQVNILRAARSRLESSLFDIAQLTRADLFDSELDAARELLNAGFTRPAGMLAGVVLEKHLAQVCENHGIKRRAQNPTIATLNEALKKGEILDVPRWRQIQRLADIRNLCGHGKDREPAKDEVTELIDGTEKFTKTLF
jgi:hypothetical protein